MNTYDIAVKEPVLTLDEVEFYDASDYRAVLLLKGGRPDTWSPAEHREVDMLLARYPSLAAEPSVTSSLASVAAVPHGHLSTPSSLILQSQNQLQPSSPSPMSPGAQLRLRRRTAMGTGTGDLPHLEPRHDREQETITTSRHGTSGPTIPDNSNSYYRHTDNDVFSPRRTTAETIAPPPTPLFISGSLPSTPRRVPEAWLRSRYEATGPAWHSEQLRRRRQQHQEQQQQESSPLSEQLRRGPPPPPKALLPPLSSSSLLPADDARRQNQQQPYDTVSVSAADTIKTTKHIMNRDREGYSRRRLPDEQQQHQAYDESKGQQQQDAPFSWRDTATQLKARHAAAEARWRAAVDQAAEAEAAMRAVQIETLQLAASRAAAAAAQRRPRRSSMTSLLSSSGSTSAPEGEVDREVEDNRISEAVAQTDQNDEAHDPAKMAVNEDTMKARKKERKKARRKEKKRLAAASSSYHAMTN